MTVTVGAIIEAFPELLQLVRGKLEAEVGRPRAPSAPEPGCILFLNRPQWLEAAVQSPAGVLVVRDADVDREALTGASQTVLRSPDPELALARVARAFFPADDGDGTFQGERIHPSAVIDASARIAADAVVGPSTVIGAGVEIGGGCVIGANTTLEAEVVIGEGSAIHSNVFIGRRTRIGKRCEVHPMTTLGTEGFGYAHDPHFNHYRHEHYGRVVLEDDVHVGASVTIDRGRFVDTVIGRGTRIDNQCHVGHNARVGRNCLMAGAFWPPAPR